MDTRQQATGSIQDASRIPATSTTHFPRTVLQQGQHSRVIGNGGTKPCRRDGDADVHPGIVVHPVVIHDRPTQLVLLQHWELLQGSAFGQHIGGLETVSAGDEIVGLDARPEVGELPPAVDGQHDRQREGEMGRDVQEVGSLVQRLLHHLVLLVVEAHDRLLQVADASVNKFRAATARPAAEVVQLHHGRLQTTGRAVQGTIEMLTKFLSKKFKPVQGTTRSRGTASDDKNVELLCSKRSKLGRSRWKRSSGSSSARDGARVLLAPARQQHVDISF